MKFGLNERQLSLIVAAFGKFPEIERVVLFGSRAMGNFKPASDLDLLSWVNKCPSKLLPD